MAIRSSIKQRADGLFYFDHFISVLDRRLSLTPETGVDTMISQDLPNIHGVRPSTIVAGEAAASAAFRAKDLMLIKPSKEASEEETAAYIERLSKMGFTIGKPVDDLFLEATFPIGWTKDADNMDSRHITIQDDKGRERIGIFYKNTYYDRYASCSFSYRINTSHQYINEEGEEVQGYSNAGHYLTVVDHIDGWKKPKELFRSNTLIAYQRGEYEKARNLESLAKEEIKQWLAVHYPDYANPLAYWD